MIFTVTVVRYRQLFIPFGLFSMALFHLPLFFQQGLTFYRLMGCGRNGTFSIQPDWQQWALVGVWGSEEDYTRFKQKSILPRWWQLLCYQQITYICQPIESHGKWGGKEPFGNLPPYKIAASESVAILTRATIRLSKLREFWQNVPLVAAIMPQTSGLITSVGIGEVPLIQQATFSVWESFDQMKAFAYRHEAHAEVIKKTRRRDWYSEELFARFKLLRIEEIPTKSSS